MKEVKNRIEGLSWQDVRSDFNLVNPKLTAIIDEISPDPSYKIFKASYAFGEEMVKEGQLQVPDEKGNIIPLSAAKQNIIDALSYNYSSNPVSMVLSGSTELFIILENYTIPLYGLIPPGKIFGSWVVLSQTPSTRRCAKADFVGNLVYN